jgi:HEPN domain-containing protein
MAKKDGRALSGMTDAEIFSTEVFGFHVQQAVEKALKAWLCCLGTAYPRTHDLDELSALLEDGGQHIPPRFAPLLDYTDFAVAFRYDAFPDLDADLDRQECVDKVSALLEHVEDILPQETP